MSLNKKVWQAGLLVGQGALKVLNVIHMILKEVAVFMRRVHSTQTFRAARESTLDAGLRLKMLETYKYQGTLGVHSDFTFWGLKVLSCLKNFEGANPL